MSFFLGRACQIGIQSVALRLGRRCKRIKHTCHCRHKRETPELDDLRLCFAKTPISVSSPLFFFDGACQIGIQSVALRLSRRCKRIKHTCHCRLKRETPDQARFHKPKRDFWFTTISIGIILPFFTFATTYPFRSFCFIVFR